MRFIQKAKQFGLSLLEIKRLIDIRAEGTPPCTSLKAMLKHHLDELERHIQEMVELRQELAKKYEEIDALISDSTPTVTENICQGKICGFIERDNE